MLLRALSGVRGGGDMGITALFRCFAGDGLRGTAAAPSPSPALAPAPPWPLAMPLIPPTAAFDSCCAISLSCARLWQTAGSKHTGQSFPLTGGWHSEALVWILLVLVVVLLPRQRYTLLLDME